MISSKQGRSEGTACKIERVWELLKWCGEKVSAWRWKLTDMVGPDFEGFLLSMKQPDPLVLFVLQQPDLPHPSLLPFTSPVVKSVQLALAATNQWRTLLNMKTRWVIASWIISQGNCVCKRQDMLQVLQKQPKPALRCWFLSNVNYSESELQTSCLESLSCLNQEYSR